MTTYNELLAFRDNTGEIRLVDTALVSAVELVQNQRQMRNTLADVANVYTAGPVLAVITGGKERPQTSSTPAGASSV